MVRSTRRTVLATVGTGMALSAGTGVSGASSHGETETDDGRGDGVRVVHLSPDAPTVDVYADGEVAFEDVDPLSRSDYLSYAPGSYTLSFVPAGEDPEEAIYETDVELESGEYTLAAMGEVCTRSDRPFELVRFEDENGPTEPGHARIRAVHASPDAPPVDVVTDGGTTLFEDLEFGQGAYADLSADEEIIELRRASGGDELARFRIDPEAGSVYTAYAVGYLDPGEAPEDAPDGLSFSLAITDDATPGER